MSSQTAWSQLNSFRPLARLIGSYTGATAVLKFEEFNMFPAPREVDRFLYKKEGILMSIDKMFPAPREVDRFLYKK